MNAYQELFDLGKQEIIALQSQLEQQSDKKSLTQSQSQIQRDGGDDDGVNCDANVDQGGDGDEMKKNDLLDKNKNQNQNIENQNPNQESKTETKSSTSSNTNTTNSNSKSNKKPTTIEIEIIKGTYQGSKYTLHPAIRKPCWIGRSTSKKFRERGISLSNDAEVSTTHGKFHIHPSSGGVNSKLVYTDTGSTNGTVYNGEEIEDQVPLELVDGMVLVIGNCHLLIHLK